MQSVSLNPYSPGGAISDPAGGFFGREEIFQFIRGAIEAKRRTPIILYGQRRIGKSSILRQIPHRLSPQIRCVYFDLQGKAGLDVDQVLFGLAREISRELRISKPEREEATEATFATEFLVRALHALDDKPERLVLLFDEFDVLDERVAGEYVAGRRFISYLATLQSKQPEIGYIIVVGRKTDELSREFNAALLTGAVQERIGRLDREHSDELVCKLAETQDVLRFSRPALDRIYSLATGHPYCTQLLCFTIWARTVTPETKSVEVTPAMVENAIMPALEYGTLGLNWIFDGLAQPAYRLFLSALAEAGDPVIDEPSSLQEIERVLQKRKVTPDRHELARAPEDLLRWDIVARGAGGFHFQVPLIGVWIRKERPLEVLEQEVRYSNPRAYSYYELANAAEQAGDLDQAISDYEGALKENPLFFEAQRDLAIALSKSDKQEHVLASIEAYERASELDDEMPKAGLIQALLRGLELPDRERQELTQYYTRIKDLDQDGSMKLRAERTLRNRAFQDLAAERFSGARTIFVMLDDTELANIASGRRLTSIVLGVITFLIGIAAAIVRLAFELPPGFKVLAVACATVCAGELFTWAIKSGASPKRLSQGNTRRFLNKRTIFPTLLRFMIGLTISYGIGFGCLRFLNRDGLAQVLAGFAGFYSLFFLTGIVEGVDSSTPTQISNTSP